MSFLSGNGGDRPGLFDSFRAAFAPTPLPEDDGKPLVPPTTVTVGTALSILAGLVFMLVGGVSLATTDQQLDDAARVYNATVADCTTEFGGVGDAVVVPANASQEQQNRAAECQRYRVLTDDMIQSAKTQSIMISAIILVIGVVAAVGGWFLRAGTRWARLMVVGAVILSVLLTMLFSVSNLLTLAATLLLVVAVMLCYIGKGGGYFARVRARRAAS